MISIIVPTLNEAGNIIPLVERIHNSLSKKKIPYEVIFVDDHSTDTTQFEIDSLPKKYPVTLFTKRGSKGKAQSILEGCSYAKSEIVAMIDADLQYPPESLATMYFKIQKGEADIVVGDRQVRNTNIFRKKAGNLFRHIFGKLLHNFEVDVQSGLKVFQKKYIKTFTSTPKPWSFDLAFLNHARRNGANIVSEEIVFDERKIGKAKASLLQTGFELLQSSLFLKLAPKQLQADALKQDSVIGNGVSHKGKHFTTHNNLATDHTALNVITKTQSTFLISLALSTVILFIFNWHLALLTLVTVLSIVYFADLMFNFFLVWRSYGLDVDIQISKSFVDSYKKDWPIYTIFCPLYKEAQVIPQFTKAMSELNYPKDKLEVMLLLEEDDIDTIQAAKEMNLPSFFKIVVVPDSYPKTKPKACNYGLALASGEFSVIYDAEDIPDIDQLKKAVIAFDHLGDEIGCIQAKLNFYNPSQNLLTRLFTLEYSLWFDLVLTGLQSINAPIPLGGTSNHFRTKNLQELQAWDGFNVTEDADLGMRLVKEGYRTAILDSVTMEEANSQTKNWFKQRSRWIKGYMQTYLVHMRRPYEFLYKGTFSDLIIFQLVVGGKILSMLINPLMWIITLLYVLNRSTLGPFIESLYLTPIYYIALFSLIIGNFLYFYYYMMGAVKREYWDLIKYCFFVPVYWLMMSGAAAYALYELIVRPHHWNKTLHGLHLTDETEDSEIYSEESLTITQPNPAYSFLSTINPFDKK